MLVSELTNRMANRREQAIVVDVEAITVDSAAAQITVGDTVFPFDEVAEKTLAKFLDIPANYLKSCPSTFKAHTANFWLDELADTEATVHTVNDQLVAITSSDIITVPTPAVGNVITKVFDGDDKVSFYRGTDARGLEFVQFDVLSNAHQVDVPNPLNIPFRPQVGDVTSGGMRFYSYPYSLTPPSALPYFERLVCTNGMTTEERLGRISIKGNTVEEVIEELETKARELFAVLDNGLQSYAETAAKRVPGSLQAFAYQLGREYKLSASVMDEVMSIINQLPEDTATVYDVNQAFTEVANRGVTAGVRRSLQTLGGSLALQADKMIQRCGTCERLL